MYEIDFCNADLAVQRQRPLTDQEVENVKEWVLEGSKLGLLAVRVRELRSGRPLTEITPAALQTSPVASTPPKRPLPAPTDSRLKFNDWERRAIGKAIAHLILTEQITPSRGRLLLQKLEAITKT